MTTLASSFRKELLSAGRARNHAWAYRTEALINGVLIVLAVFSIFTTFAIIAVLLSETYRFFLMPDVSFGEFFLGGRWSPLLGGEKHFGMWPLLGGTVLVTAVSAVLALPIGLITAVYLSEYAPHRLRAVLKPVLEILAGIPTVVYGFFALTVITPALKWLLGDSNVDGYNALSAGLAVGIMTLPIVCSLSEDALQAVPRALREGAFATGATKFDVSVKIVVPAALSGIIASYLLAIARAVGETMIVALAAGSLAQLTLDPRQSVQTMTGWMVQIFLGDAPADGVEYKSCYAIGSVLFVLTFVLTIIGNRVLARFREEYD